MSARLVVMQAQPSARLARCHALLACTWVVAAGHLPGPVSSAHPDLTLRQVSHPFACWEITCRVILKAFDSFDYHIPHQCRQQPTYPAEPRLLE